MTQLWSERITTLVNAGRTISHQYDPHESVIKLLENQKVYFKSDMSTDADGSPRATQIDPDGQLETSLHRQNGWHGEGEFVNAEKIPYFVLPLNFKEVTNVSCKLGDMALIRYRDKEVFAIYADQGPRRLLGEGSVKLVESLGANPWNHDRTRVVSGIGFGVDYLVFPHSSETFGIPATFDEIQTVGRRIFEATFGNGDSSQSNTFSMTSEEMQTKWREGDISVNDVSDAPEFKIKTALNLRNGIGTEHTTVLATIPTETVVKTAVVTTPEIIKNVGATEKGLWLSVNYNGQKGFVRAKEEYLLPWYHNAQSTGENSFDYSYLPFLQALTQDKKLTESESKNFYQNGIVPLCNNRELFNQARTEGYVEVPGAQNAPCATTASAVLESAFRIAEMPTQAEIFNNHANFIRTHEVEIMLYRLGFNYWFKKEFKSQKGAIGLMGGRSHSHGAHQHSGHIYTIFSEIDKKFDLIGDNGGYNHEYRGEGFEVGTEGFWLPSSITPQQR